MNVKSRYNLKDTVWYLLGAPDVNGTLRRRSLGHF